MLAYLGMPFQEQGVFPFSKSEDIGMSGEVHSVYKGVDIVGRGMSISQYLSRQAGVYALLQHGIRGISVDYRKNGRVWFFLSEGYEIRWLGEMGEFYPFAFGSKAGR